MSGTVETPIGLVLAGAGNRARTYGKYLRRPDSYARVVAVVEPNAFRRNAALEAYSLPETAGFETWDDFLHSGLQGIRAAVITTPDHLHCEIAMSALRDCGYHVLLEKPIAQSYRECLDIARTAQERGLTVGICHPLRYHPFFVKLRELAWDEELVGSIVRIEYTENIGIDRMIHAFVRGLWRNEAQSNTLLVSKCCHDIDYLVWLTGSAATAVQSAGSLSLFRPEKAPAANDGAERCLDCPMERECPYSAVELYLRRRKWLRHFDLPDGFGDTDIRRVLRKTTYGKCVYRVGDNDVWDHQSVTMTMRNGVQVSLNVNGVTSDEGRRVHIMGSCGELWGDERTIWLRRYAVADLTGEALEREWHFASLADAPGHAGADYAIVEDFLEAIRRGTVPLCDISHSLEAYRIAFLEK